MTTYLLLTLHDDGRAEMYTLPEQYGVDEIPKLAPSAVGFDRGPYSTFSVGDFSIDVQLQISRERVRQATDLASTG